MTPRIGTMSTSNSNFRSLFICSLLLAFVPGALFAPALGFDYVNFDDPVYVTENPALQAGLNLDTIHWAFTSAHGGHWHPVTWLSHALDIELFGVSATAHHAVNIGIHCVNAVLAFLFLALATGRTAPSFFCALIFAIHPLRIESVVWISERKDVLHIFFGLLAMLCYRQYLVQRSVFYYCAMLSAFILGLLSKPMLVTLPLLLIVLDYWPLSENESKSGSISNRVRLLGCRILSKIPLLILSGLVSVLCLWAQREGGGLRSLDEVSFVDRALLVVTGYATYLGKLFWPVNLSVFYPLYTPSIAAALGSGAALVLVSMVVWQRRNVQPYLLSGWCWFLLAAAPISGIISVGGQFVADRWTYLPHLGLLFALSFWWFDRATNSVLRTAVPICACCLLALSTWQQLPTWRTSISLYEQALSQNSENYLAHNNLGATYLKAGDVKKAEFHFQRAHEANQYYPRPLVNLARLRVQQGRFREAKELLTTTLKLTPHHTGALLALARLQASTGKPVEALATYGILTHVTPHKAAHVAEIKNLIFSQRKKICRQLAAGKVSANSTLPQTPNLATFCADSDV